jgi:hypothetical protein
MVQVRDPGNYRRQNGDLDGNRTSTISTPGSSQIHNANLRHACPDAPNHFAAIAHICSAFVGLDELNQLHSFLELHLLIERSCDCGRWMFSAAPTKEQQRCKLPAQQPDHISSSSATTVSHSIYIYHDAQQPRHTRSKIPQFFKSEVVCSPSLPPPFQLSTETQPSRLHDSLRFVHGGGGHGQVAGSGGGRPPGLHLGDHLRHHQPRQQQPRHERRRHQHREHGAPAPGGDVPRQQRAHRRADGARAVDDRRHGGQRPGVAVQGAVRAEVGGHGRRDQRVGAVHQHPRDEHERDVPRQRDAPVDAVEEERRDRGEGEARGRQRPGVQVVGDVAGEDAADNATHIEQS